MKTEQLDKTENDMIFVERDTPYTREEVDEKLRLLAVAEEEDVSVLKEALAKAVPTYKDSHIVNKNASQSKEMQLVNC